MGTRLGLAATLLAAGIPCLLAHWYLASTVCFVFLFLLVVEAGMFSFLRNSRFNIVVGTAGDAIQIENHDMTREKFSVICVPISIRIPFWEVRNLRAFIVSDSEYIDTVTIDKDGVIEEAYVFDLRWDSRKRFIAIGYSDGTNVLIGNPIMHKYLPKRSQYPIRLGIRQNGELICHRDYWVTHQDIQLSDYVGGNN